MRDIKLLLDSLKVRGNIDYIFDKERNVYKVKIINAPFKYDTISLNNNGFYLPIQVELKDVREISKDTYENILKNPKLINVGIGSYIKTRVSKLLGIPEPLIEVQIPKIEKERIEKGDYLPLSPFIKIKGFEKELTPFTLEYIVALGDDIFDESVSSDTRVEFVDRAVELAKEKLKEVV